MRRAPLAEFRTCRSVRGACEKKSLRLHTKCGMCTTYLVCTTTRTAHSWCTRKTEKRKIGQRSLMSVTASFVSYTFPACRSPFICWPTTGAQHRTRHKMLKLQKLAVEEPHNAQDLAKGREEGDEDLCFYAEATSFINRCHVQRKNNMSETRSELGTANPDCW